VPLAIPLLHDYQRRRIDVFLDPTSDPLGAGYHVTQSIIAMGSGGILGKGFLRGTQSQLDFLPEKHTDFIFTTIAEEWGFIGALTVLFLIGMLLIVLLGMALRVTSRAGRLLVCGSMLSIFAYAMINIGMVSGLLPVVGIPLPFISYGGTAMMTLLFGLGLAMCAWVHRDERLDPRGRL
jgi:rod shape determining protein RodA